MPSVWEAIAPGSWMGVRPTVVGLVDCGGLVSHRKTDEGAVLTVESSELTGAVESCDPVGETVDEPVEAGPDVLGNRANSPPLAAN